MNETPATAFDDGKRQRLLLARIAVPDDRDRQPLLEGLAPADRQYAEAVLGRSIPDNFLESPFFVPGSEEFDAPLLTGNEADPQSHPGWWLGKTIHVYTLTRLLPAGSGGQGYVFEATENSAVTRTVAFKLLRPDLPDEMRERFFREAQVLARLNSPYIVPLLNAGVHIDSAGGRHYPFLVTPLLKGEWITDYCLSHAMTIEQRLSLFRRACAGVADAHANLILHRDLKPSNVLVAENGDVHLLDFGIAEEIVTGDAEPNSDRFALTLAYASPEQLVGKPLDVRSDVYSLGLLLDEMLAGVEAHSAAQVELNLLLNRTGTLAPPSATPQLSRSARQRLRGDADAVVMKAVASDPDDRYATVRELDQDIERLLAGRPVQARRGTAWYRFSKWVCRNRFLSAAAATALVLVAFSYGREVAARRLAESRLDAVRAVALRLARMQDVIDNESTLGAKKKAVEEAMAALQQLSSTASGNVALLSDLAEAYERLGDIQGRRGHASLGDPAAALASYRHCSDLLRQAGSEAPLRRAASCLMKSGDMVDDVQGQDAALGVYTDALMIDRKLLALSPGDRKVQSGIATDLQRIGNVLLVKQDFKGARERYTESTKQFETLGLAPGASVDDRSNLASGYTKLGELERQLGNNEAALDWFKKALVLDEARAKEQSDNSEAQRNYSASLNSVSKALSDLGRMQEALKYALQSLAIDEKTAEREPIDQLALRDLSASLDDVGAMERSMGDLRSSEQVLRRSVRVSLENLRRNSKSRDVILDVAVAEHQLTETLTDENNFAEARGIVSDAARRVAYLTGRDPQDAEARRELRINRFQSGRVEEMAGNLEKATAWYQEAYGLRPTDEASAGSPRLSLDTAEILLRWGRCLASMTPESARQKVAQAAATFVSAERDGHDSPDLVLLSGEALALDAALGGHSSPMTEQLSKNATAVDKLLAVTPRRVQALRVAVMLREAIGRRLQASGDLSAARAEIRRANERVLEIERMGLLRRADARQKSEQEKFLASASQ